MKNTLNTILAQAPSVLQKHPAVGGLGGVGGGILYWIEIAGPVLSFVGVVAITLHLKMMEWKEKRKKLNN